MSLEIFAGAHARAEVAPPPASPESYAKQAALYDLARAFVARIGKGFDAADAAMGIPAGQRQAQALMPEGDMLFNLSLGDQMDLDGVVAGEIRDRKVLVSLRDYVASLQFPITVDPKSGTAAGWFIREDKKFKLDVKARTVLSDGRAYVPGDRVVITSDDIMAPPEELAQWFNLSSETIVSNLQIKIKSSVPLPIEERMQRANRKIVSKQNGPPQLPPITEQPVDIAFPRIDVSNLTAYAKSGASGETLLQDNASISTRGDFMNGRLATQTQLNDTDKLASVRASYIRESLKPELLGALGARRYELGDLNSVRMPMAERTSQGTGMRVSNIDPARTYTNSSVGITGNAPPGWDVELYRDSQYLGSRNVGTDGVYKFEDVDLFRSNNDFHVVLYGPQGEMREEKISVPVDPYRLAEEGSAYDVSLSFDGAQAYRKLEGPENEGSPRLSAVFEKPIGKQSAVQMGVESSVRGDSERVQSVQSGLSTVLGPALVNADAALENTGEAGAELVVRADLGKNQLRNETTLSSDHFAVAADQEGREVFKNTLTATGPLNGPIGTGARYNVTLEHALSSNDAVTDRALLGYSAGLGYVSLNEQLEYTKQTSYDDQLLARTSLRGFTHGLRIRGDLSYQIAPESHVDEVVLNLQRSIGEDLDLEFEHLRRPDDDYSENRIQANYRTGYATLSPSIVRNSSGDVTALLNTSFGVTRDGRNGKYRFSDQTSGSSGAASVLVFLDKDGDGVHGDDEEVIPEAIILAPQNGGQATTGEDGYAYFSQLQSMRPSDLFIQPDSLQDPFWIPAGKGVSFLPREGHVVEISLPVHMAGEIEGTVYMRPASQKRPKGKHHKTPTTAPVPARSVSLALYDHAGGKIMTTTSEFDGYYSFSPVPPGDYFLVVDETGLPRDEWMRPDPVPVKIGYDGTSITGQDVYMDPGADVPMRVVADSAQIEKSDPALSEKSLLDKTVVLNLGQYHSRLLMSVMWFKVQKLEHKAVAGLAPLVEPSESYADAKTGEHTLRIGAAALDLKDAKKRCAAIAKAGVACTVEVLPGGLTLAAK